MKNPNTTQRPEAPDSLSDDQKLIWNKTVDALPPDWFRAETHDLLAQYCQTVDRASHIEKMLRAFRKENKIQDLISDISKMKTLDVLNKMAERETRSASSLATRLRITLQATVTKKANKFVDQEETKPWEDEDDFDVGEYDETDS